MPPAAISPEAKSEPGEISLSASAPCAAAFRGLIDEPAHHAADKDGQRGADGQIRADGEGERADAEQLDGDDERDAEQHQSPGQLAAQDAVDDGGHEAGLRRGRAGAADALNPMHLNVAGGGRVEILAVLQLGGADGVEQNVLGLLDAR